MNASDIVDKNWDKLVVGLYDFTPDEVRASTFTVERIDQNEVTVLANLNSPISIPKSTFVYVVQVLQDRNSKERNPLRIGSSNDNVNSLELCLGAKAHCNGTRAINYIVPLLQRMGIVGIGHARPNTVWLHGA